jgi:hypothetical protein
MYLRKVTTLTTLLVINNLSGYKSDYIFCEVATSFIINNLKVNINDNAIEVTISRALACPLLFIS